MTSDFGAMSTEAHAALERDLDALRAERAQVAATLQDTDEAGDSADQADRLQRAMRLQLLDDRIAEVTRRLDAAATAGPPRADVVGVGSIVTVRFDDDSVQTVHLGEIAEELDPTLVTTDSPLGRALLGHRAGEVVSYDTPDGQTTAVLLSLGEPSAPE